MIVVGKQELYDFHRQHADARSQIESWLADAEAAGWKTPHDVRANYPKVSLPGDRNAVFDICGDDYRLWVRIDYVSGYVFVKKIGTHKEYDKWDIN